MKPVLFWSHLTCGQGAYIQHLEPSRTCTEPPKRHFFFTHLTYGKVVCIHHLGPWESQKEYLLSDPEGEIWLHFLGSGPNRGQSPAEWGDFPSPPLGHPPRSEAQPAIPEAWGTEYGKSPHSAGLCPLSGQLPKKCHFAHFCLQDLIPMLGGHKQ